MENNSNQNNNQVMRMIFLISQIGITMLTTIFMCIGIGWLLDHFLHTHLLGWFIGIGCVAGINSVYILIKRFLGNTK